MIWLQELLLAAKLVFIVVVILGWGCLLALILARALRTDLSLDGSALVLYGLYLTILFSQLAPFFGPVGQRSGLGWALTGAALFALRIRHCAQAFGGPLRATALLIALIIGMLLPAAIIVPRYDAGLYHYQFVQWMVEHGTVFGLANVQGRFGFNSAWLTAGALFSSTENSAKGVVTWHIAAAILLCIGLLWRGLCALGRGQPVSGSYCLVVSAMMLVFPGPADISLAPSTDLPTTLVIIHAFASALAWSESRTADNYVLLACCVALSLVMKVSSAPIAALLFIGMFRARPDAAGRRRILTALAMVAALLTAWIAQNVALSGCLIYPAVRSCLHLRWSVDAGHVANEARWVTSWARAPGHHLDDPILRNFAWLEPWTALQRDFLRQFGILLAVAACAAIVIPAIRRPQAPLAIMGLPLIVSIVGIVFWFLAGPDPRFGAGFIVSLPALIAARGIFMFRRSLIALFFLVPVIYTKNQVRELRLHRNDPNFQNLAAGFHLPKAKIVTRVTRHGTVISVTHRDDRCWLAELPCTPYFNSDLGESKIVRYRMYYVGD